MTDGDALRRAIVAEPADDTPRLIYADWLDETGTDPDRAAFIRAQIDASRAEPFRPARRAAEARANALLAPNKTRWTSHLLRSVIDASFTRGFIEDIIVDAARFPHVADAVFEADPIRSVRVVRVLVEADPTPREHTWLTPFFDLPQLRRVTRLDLRGTGLQPEEGYALGKSPSLAGVRELSVRDNPLSPDWVTDLILGVGLPELAALDVAEIPHLGPALIRGLARTRRRLTELDASGVVFDSEQMQVLLATPGLQEVEALRLGWTDPGTPGPLTHLDLGWVLPWGRLRVLDLAGQKLGPEGVLELDRRPEAANLRWLGLASNALGSSGARNLAAAKRLNPFYLDVRGNDLGPRDVAALRRRFPDAEVVA